MTQQGSYPVRVVRPHEANVGSDLSTINCILHFLTNDQIPFERATMAVCMTAGAVRPFDNALKTCGWSTLALQGIP